MIRKSHFYLLASLTLLAFSCKKPQSEAELPIFGRKEVVEREVNGKMVQDTLYHTISTFEFVNQDSAIVTNATFDNKVYVADFFFTSCPTICPRMKTQMLRVYEAFNESEEVAILSHTIDPEYDSVALLADYAARLGVSSDVWHFVTGDKDKIYDIAERSYMVEADADEQAPGGFIHSGAFLLVDKNGRIRGVYDGTIPEQVDLLIKDIKKLTGAS